MFNVPHLRLVVVQPFGFALPFALACALRRARTRSPGHRRMDSRGDGVGAHAAMVFNRLFDARLDALNPRTRRDLPRGALSFARRPFRGCRAAASATRVSAGRCASRCRRALAGCSGTLCQALHHVYPYVFGLAMAWLRGGGLRWSAAAAGAVVLALPSARGSAASTAHSSRPSIHRCRACGSSCASVRQVVDDFTPHARGDIACFWRAAGDPAAASYVAGVAWWRRCVYDNPRSDGRSCRR